MSSSTDTTLLKTNDINLITIQQQQNELLECKEIVKVRNHQIDSIVLEIEVQKGFVNILTIKNNRQDTIINNLQENINYYVDMIASRDALIKKIENLKWHERLFKEKKIIQEFKQQE